MTYDQLQAELSKQGLRTSKVINVGVKEERTVAIHVDCNPMQKWKVEVKIKEICRNEFVVHWIGNGNDYFFITANKNFKD